MRRIPLWVSTAPALVLAPTLRRAKKHSDSSFFSFQRADDISYQPAVERIIPNRGGHDVFQPDVDASCFSTLWNGPAQSAVERTVPARCETLRSALVGRHIVPSSWGDIPRAVHRAMRRVETRRVPSHCG